MMSAGTATAADEAVLHGTTSGYLIGDVGKVVRRLTPDKEGTSAIFNSDRMPTSIPPMAAIRPVLVPPQSSAPDKRAREVVLVEWEGAVERVEGGRFFARLRDRSSSVTHATEVAELPLEDVSVDDRALVQPGGIFYMSIGRRIHPDGRHERVAGITFRRLPAWSRRSLEQIEREADALYAFMSRQEHSSAAVNGA